jgi:hypothetical protein
MVGHITTVSAEMHVTEVGRGKESTSITKIEAGREKRARSGSAMWGIGKLSQLEKRER